jgi:DNA-binding response OmpR family regulator
MTDKPLVLIAEDDAGVRMTLEFVLADEGFEVLSAEDGEQALNLALERSPDAILLDGRMPKLTGKQVLTALRALRATAETPVFVLTGMDPAFENEGGADAEWPGAHFIGKPFDPDELVEGIRRVLDVQR